MEQIFITDLTIKKVRHLRNILIPLSEKQIKHLILTGKNGSGKTSVVEALAANLSIAFSDFYLKDRDLRLREYFNYMLKQSGKGVEAQFNQKIDSKIEPKESYHYVQAYYSADRVFEAEQPRHVEKVQLKDHYGMSEFPRTEFVKYLLDLKMTEALARNNDKTEKAEGIRMWFQKLEQLLKQIFDDTSVKLLFDEETFEFHISQDGKELFDFNTLSSGYQAVLDIVLDIIMRMEKQTSRSFDFNLPGIVLVDEIETHLHLELQKNIMPILTTIFPNIQFIVTTHSPFILNSLNNVVIYDLENHILAENGLDNIPYEGVVEGYFGADKLSNTLKQKYERYKSLVNMKGLSDDDMCEIAELEMYLDEIPDYLAIGFATEYQRLKLEFMNREDIDG